MKSLLTAACLLIGAFAYGQTYKGIELLEQGKCQEAHQLLLKDSKKGKSKVMAYYALARLYSQDCGYQDALSAVKSAGLYYEEFRKLDSKKKKELKTQYGTDLKARQAWQPTIVKLAQKQAREKGDAKVLFMASQVFLLSFEERASLQREACEIVLEQLAKGNACETAPAVLAEYGSIIKRASPDFIIPIDSVIFRCFKDERGDGWIDAFPEFKAANPTSAYVRDIGTYDFQKLCKSPDYEGFQFFIRTYPQSVYVFYAQEYLAKLEPEYMRKSIKEATSPEAAFHLFQQYIAPDIKSKNWKKALEKWEEIAIVLSGNEWFSEMKALLEAPEEQVNKQPLGVGVNTDAGEYVPVLSADGQTLFFCGQKRPDGKGGEDVFVSRLQPNGEWGKAVVIKELSKALNNEAPLSLSADGNRLYIFDTGKIGYSDKVADGWGEIELMQQPFNSAAWQADAVIAADGRTMVFAMDTEDEGVNIDVFVSFLQPDGQWSPPLNLGAGINTDKTDRTPFMHPDMRTLYYSSDGKGGFGGMDVFMTTRLDNSWTKWSKPVNIGKDLNTPESDWGYKISTDGQVAFFSAQVKENNDIYRANLPERLRPAPVKEIAGKIDGLLNKSSLAIRVIDKVTGDTVGDFKTDPQTGEYYVVVPKEVEPVIQILSQEVFVRDIEVGGDSAHTSHNISVVDLRAKEGAIQFQDVLFETGKHDIRDSFKKDLDRLSVFIKKGNVEIVIEGHTDNVGNAEANKGLSQRRAEAVRKYLIDKGCAAMHIKAVGYGITQPIDSNDTPEGRANNRRVTLRFTKN